MNGSATFRYTRELLSGKAKIALILLVLTSVLISAVIAVLPVLLKWSVDSQSHDGSLSPQGFKYLALYATVFVLIRLVAELRLSLYGPFEQRLQGDLYARLSDHLVHGSINTHRQGRSGETVQTLAQGVNGVRSALFVLVFSIIPLAFELLLSAVAISVILPAKYSMIMITGIVLYGIGFFLTVQRLRAAHQEGLRSFMTAGGVATDIISNLEIVRAFRAEDRVMLQLRKFLRAATESWSSWYRQRAFVGAGLSLVLNGAFAAALTLAGFEYASNMATAGAVILIATYLIQLGRPVELIGSSVRDLRQSIESVQNLDNLLVPHVENRPPTEPVPNSDVAISLRSTGYSINDTPILVGVDFDIRLGEVIAIRGESGVGKSTLLRLICGLLHPSGGTLFRAARPDGAPLNINIVPQDPSLLNDTLRENLLLGGIPHDDEAIRSLLERLSLDELVSRLPFGLDTYVGERGHTLSGGERQRIAIARALLASPDILLLDEATSALDPDLARRVLAEVSRRCANRAAIVLVTHRQQDEVPVDSTYVLVNGRLKPAMRKSTSARPSNPELCVAAQ